jgi:putative spermidine/putrescine transport system substrate-binding protein
VVGLVAFMLGLAGCDDDDDDGGGGGEALTELGEPEGELNLINWVGYVEDGSTDPTADWVTGFEKETGCQVNSKVATTSDEMVDLMRTGQYDGVSASGNASLRLIDGGDVAPVNLDLVPNYETVFEDMKDQPFNTVDGTNYGTPHGRGANLLMWRTDDVQPDPTSWGAILDPAEAAKHKGKISVYDDPIYIADAAVYLKTHNPELGIEDPYELDQEQFDAAVDLLKEQNPNVGEYWHDALKQISSFESGDAQIGTTWQYQYFTLLDGKTPVKAPGPDTGFVPEEGATGWFDTWMLSNEAKHPNCMYLWMNHIIDPKVNAQVAEWFGEAPAQSLSCDETSDKDFCTKYHADDPGFWEQVYYWKTPLADCGDDRGSECVDYNDWVSAWTEIKG